MLGERYFSRYPSCPDVSGGQQEEGGDGPQHVGQEQWGYSMSS